MATITVVDRIASVAKAITSAVLAGLAALAGIVAALPDGQGLTDLGTGAWITVAIAVLGGGGITWLVPNKPVAAPTVAEAATPVTPAADHGTVIEGDPFTEDGRHAAE